MIGPLRHPTSTRARRCAWRALGAGALVLALASCRSAPSPASYSRPFPPTLRQTRTLDIQVVRDGTRIELTNTTARAFGPSSIWLNRRYVRPIERLGVGQTLRLSLTDFRDEYGEAYRAGGFFAADAPDRLVHAEIESTGADGKPELLGLVVVGGGL